MNPNIFSRRRSERFAQLLDEANGGPRHHARARVDDQLAELVAVGHQLSTARPAAEVDPDFRIGLRAMLVATAEREGIGVTDRAAEAGPVAQTWPVSHARTASSAARRLRARGAIVVGVAVGAVAVSGMSAASENAMPGDALYGVKRSTERAQLALSSSEITRGQLFLDFARNRLAEAAGAPGAAAGLPRVFADMDEDTRQGVRLLTTSAVRRKDEAPLNAVDRFLVAQRREISRILPRLAESNQARALQSMLLLDDVDRRARSLRDGLPCGAAGTTADSLGPQPRSCGAASGPAVDPRRNREPAPESGNGRPDAGQPRPEKTDQARTADDPTPRVATPTPTRAATGVTPSAPAVGPMEQPPPPPEEDDGVVGDIGRMFDGILG